MRVILDVKSYAEGIELELLRKSKNPETKNIFFDIELKFTQQDAKYLKDFLEERYAEVIITKCKRGIYEVFVTM